MIGEITQLGVTPLTKKMDEFIDVFAGILKDKYGYELQYEKVTKFLGMPKMAFPNDSFLLYLALIPILAFVVIMFMALYF